MDPNYLTAAAAVIAALVPLLAELRRWRNGRSKDDQDRDA
jgi:hypothetical protein